MNKEMRIQSLHTLDINHHIQFSSTSCHRILKMACSHKLSCISVKSPIFLLREYVKIFGRSFFFRLLTRGETSATQRIWPCCHLPCCEPASIRKVTKLFTLSWSSNIHPKRTAIAFHRTTKTKPAFQ